MGAIAKNLAASAAREKCIEGGEGRGDFAQGRRERWDDLMDQREEFRERLNDRLDRMEERIGGLERRR